MQTITNTSKYLILILLSCTSVLVTRNSLMTDSNDSLQLPQVAELEVPKMPSLESFYTQQQSDTIWQAISSSFSLDHKADDPRVRSEIRKLLANRDHFNKVLKNAGPYMYFIYQQTKAYGLPAEIAMIPFIESEFSPNDHSNKGALGLWQLMPATARGLGVKVGHGYDGRRNVISSTQAALKYFNYLGTMFDGNWYLAIAAYNSGEGTVLAAKRRAGSTDYFQLNHLPLETRLYVPKLLAVAEIISHPEKYGVTLPEIKDQPYFTKVKLEKPATLSKVAKKSGIQLTTLRKLNPDVKPGVAAPIKNGERALLVPVDKADLVKV